MTKPKKGQWWHKNSMMESGCGGGVQIIRTDRWYVYLESSHWAMFKGSYNLEHRLRKEYFIKNYTYIHDD